MTRRLGSRSVTVERPRQKGWWGEPEENQLENEFGTLSAAPRDSPRRPAPQRIAHAATPVGRSLTPSHVEAIRTVMRLFVDDDTANGIDPRCTLFCHRCNGNRRAIGSVRYDRLTLCHDCSVDYEITRARGLIDGAAEFLERFAPRAASA